MESSELRKKFLDFFAQHGHKIVPSSSLIPDDPSVLLTTAGMQQFKKYYTLEADPMRDFGSKNTASIQKTFRTSDIDEVGDESHNTFFEMLGNFSFGGYFKKEAITYAYDFIIKELGLSIDYVTIFEGAGDIPVDEESEKIWKYLGITDVRKRGIEDNLWGPTGDEGPFGPTTEIYVNDMEVWNIVFNQYYQRKLEPKLGERILPPGLEELEIKGVDTGMGLERLAMIVQNKKNIFETDLFAPLIEPFAMLPSDVSQVHQRIIVDHARGSSFLIADGVRPSNKGAGYVLRRLMRRIFMFELIYKLPPHLLNGIIHNIIYIYGGFYRKIRQEQDTILEEFKKEREVFVKAFNRGVNELKKRYPGPQVQEVIKGKPFTPFVVNQHVGREAADLHQTYGLPVEIIREYLKHSFYRFDEKEFNEEVEKAFKKHQEISRAGQEKKFGGHGLLLDTGELKAANEEELKIVTRLHTATHLLNAALHKVLGDSVTQNGSDITVERTRFDFNFSRKLTLEEIKKIEDAVNYAIQKNFPVTIQILPLEEAKNIGALYMERSKYPDPVKIYTVGDETEIFSRELCGGPHVSHTGEIGRFRIAKEESSSAGVRRIRGIVE